MLVKKELISWLTAQGDRTFEENGDVCATCVITMFLREHKGIPDVRTGRRVVHNHKGFSIKLPKWAQNFIINFDFKMGKNRTTTAALSLLSKEY